MGNIRDLKQVEKLKLPSFWTLPEIVLWVAAKWEQSIIGVVRYVEEPEDEEKRRKEVIL